MKTKILFAATCLLFISLTANAQSSPILSGGFSTSIQVSSGSIQSSNREFSNNGCCGYHSGYYNQANCSSHHHHCHKGKHKHKHKCKHHDGCDDDDRCDNDRRRDNDRDCCRRDD